MHNTVARLNSLSAFATSTLMVLLAAIAFTSLVRPAPALDGRVDVKGLNVVMGRASPYARKEEEFVFARFDVDADVRPLFQDWNTKQVFLHLTADVVRDGKPSRTVLWDRIVRRKADGRVRIEGAKNKYSWKGGDKGFRNAQNVTLSLGYDIQPYVGILQSGVVARTSTPVDLPPVKRGVA